VSSVPAGAVEPFEVFELCLDQSVSGVQGTYIEGPLERIRSQGQRKLDYQLYMPLKIVDDTKRQVLDTFYYCLEGNGFVRSAKFPSGRSFVTFEAVRDDRLRARVEYLERFGSKRFGFEESSISISIMTD
jgi:hypothetical protein